jgi:glycosyltransferase involved in cell wall biosynthesis
MIRCGIVVDNELNSDVRVLREIGILRDHGFEIFVLCFSFRKTYSNPLPGISVTRIKIYRKIKDILFFMLNTIPVYEWIWAARIKKHILSNNIDVLHVHDLYMARAAFNGIKNAKKTIPLILDLHENYPFTITTYNWTKGLLRSFISRPDLWKKKEKEYLEYADKIIVLSQDFRDLLTSRYPELPASGFVVLPNVPDLSKVSLKINNVIKSPFRQDFPVIFYYGVIAERRGVFDSLEVFKSLIKENYQANYLLIGPVDKKDKTFFLKLINNVLFAGKVHYIPWIKPTELFDYLKISDICIAPFHKNPQHESGVANKIYEYMLGEKPIIASDCIPQQNLIEKHKCGLIFRDLAEFKDDIIRLLEDKELRISLGKNGFDAIMKEYHVGIVKENLISAYKTTGLREEAVKL